MKAIFKSNLSFLLPYLFFLVVGGFLLLFNSKADLHLTFNEFHYPVFDVAFSYITYLGDGIIVLLSAIILLVVSYRYAIIVTLSNFIASAITQVLKHLVFADVVRPKKFFEGVHDLYFVPGIDNHLYNSFPSGHTTCAFSLYLSFALIVKKPALKALFFTVALLVGYSRIYLSQHFLSDVYAGSVIGVFVTLIVYYLIQKNNSETLDNSILSFFKN